MEVVRGLQVPWTRSSLWVALKSTLHVAFVQIQGFENGGQQYKTTIAKFNASTVKQVLEMH